MDLPRPAGAERGEDLVGSEARAGDEGQMLEDMVRIEVGSRSRRGLVSAVLADLGEEASGASCPGWSRIIATGAPYDPTEERGPRA